MAIADPHAIPESSELCVEYVHEGDAAWDAQNNDLAYDLYNSVRNSNFGTVADYDHVNLRLGLIAQTRGDIDGAVTFFHASHDPAARDALHALTNATTDDRTPSADLTPETAEEAFAWIDAALAAEHAQEWDTALGLYDALLRCTVLTPGQQGTTYLHGGTAHEHLGHPDDARTWYELGLSLASDQDQINYLRERIKALGGGHAFAVADQPVPDDDSPAAAQVEAGNVAYENGDGAAARTAFEAALHLDGTDTVKGRAHYYLAAMDYQEGKYAESRNHLESALSAAPEPERGWAQAMLAWRWDEHPAAQAAQAPAQAPGQIDPGY